MKRECFTCSNKLSTEITSVERKRAIYKELQDDGNPDPFVGDMEYHCKVTGKRISQTDQACNHYSADALRETIRKDLARVAKKLREELNQ